MKRTRIGAAIQGRVRRLGATLDPGALAKMEQHFDLVMRWNRAVDLTAVRHAEAAADFYAEAVEISDLMPEARPGALVDLGSGGGFPGLVLAILRPAWKVLLVERGARKSVFLQEAARTLGLPHVGVLERNLRRPDDLPAGWTPDLLTMKAVGRFTLALDLLEGRGSPAAGAVLLAGEAGAAEVEAEISRRDGRLRLAERRRLAGRSQAYALVVRRASAL